MAVVKEFDFKLATAKDIPPSWYELVLRPELFQEHIDSLYSSKHVEPSALFLIATFLEKAFCIPGQAPLGEGVSVSKEKRTTLIDCALFTTTFLKWDVSLLEKKLPSAVLHALFTNLACKFPLKSSSSLVNASSEVLCAQTLHSLWVVHCLAQLDPPTSSHSYQWEGTCSSLENIKQLVRPELGRAIKILNEVTSMKKDFQLPCDKLQLSNVLGGRDNGNSTPCMVKLPFTLRPMPYKDIHAQIHFDLGKIYFESDEYSKALENFGKTKDLLENSRPHLLIDQKVLAGYLRACKLIADERDHPSSPLSMMATFEGHRHRNIEEAIQNLPSPSLILPAAYRVGLEKDISDWSETATLGPSRSKRQKLDDGTDGCGLSLQLCVWDIVQSVLEGKGVKPLSLKVLLDNKENHQFIDLLLTHIETVLHKPASVGVTSTRLTLFLRTLNRSDELWTSCVVKHPLVNEALGISNNLFILLKPNQISSSIKPPSSLFINEYSRLIPILASSSPSSLMKSVSDLFQITPASDHVPIANTLQGDSREFANVGQMNTSLLCAQYNGLIRKGTILLERKDYKAANEFYSLALKIVNTSSSPSRLRLVPILMEQNLRLKMLAAESEIPRLTSSKAHDAYLGLLEEAKNIYANSKKSSSDPTRVSFSGVFLLNMQEYEALARLDHSSLHERICPRLAVAAHCVVEERDLRRCTRELFETVSGVFSSHRGGSDSGQQRKYLELIANHLKDPLCLSYLLSALVRLWNLVKKPENDLTSEYTSNWPTAVGNIGSIKHNHVMRVLELTLSNATKTCPTHHYWYIMGGDISFATGKFSSALSLYLEAGARDSDFFEKPVSNSIWNQQVYHRIISCCCHMELFSQAIVICQYLDPPDYTFAFALLKDHAGQVLEFMFDYLWDMTIIEYLIYLLAKQGDNTKQSAAVQTASRPELNIHNSKDILNHVVSVRKRGFFRNFYRTLIVPAVNIPAVSVE